MFDSFWKMIQFINIIFWFIFDCTTIRLRSFGFCTFFFLILTGTCSFLSDILGRLTGLASNACSSFVMTVTATKENATTISNAWMPRLISAALDLACFVKICFFLLPITSLLLPGHTFLGLAILRRHCGRLPSWLRSFHATSLWYSRGIPTALRAG